MNEQLDSRRRFLQLASGLAAAPLGLGLPDPVLGRETTTPGIARLADAAIELRYDQRLRSCVSHLPAAGAAHTPLQTRWGVAEFLLLSDGQRIEHFALQEQRREEISDSHGKGTRLELTGSSPEGVHKRVQLRLYARYPGFVFVNVRYCNQGAHRLKLKGWTNTAYACPVATTHRAGGPEYWSYSGATHPDRRDWVQPLHEGFQQDNFLGMSGSDYGGGNPIVDVWRRDAGLAVGHLELLPQQVYLPLALAQGNVGLAVRGEQEQELAQGACLETPEGFVAVHTGDYFATLDTYRRIMADRGIVAPPAPATSYEPIWCAWGYERDVTVPMIEGTLAKVRDMGLDWAVIDDGWQQRIGDWNLDPGKFPRGDEDMRQLVASIRAQGLKPRLWWSPLSVVPGADLLHDHTDMLLRDKDGAVQNITWWNSFYLCPAYGKTVANAQELVRKFIGDWGFAGLKIDGQHLNGVAPCYNPAHHHAHPQESGEKLHEFFRAIYETALQINPQAVIEICPCGTAYAFQNFPYMNQAPASDPESSWQVRHKGKTLKALMGPSAPYAGDHVELSDGHDDFASTVGIGAVVSTKFTWPVDPKPKDSFLLTPEREQLWRKWIGLYRAKMLSTGRYRGELYDIGFDKPEAHVVEQQGHLYYAFYAKSWRGAVTLRGLAPGSYRVYDYFHEQDLGTVSSGKPVLNLAFEGFALLEAIAV